MSTKSKSTVDHALDCAARDRRDLEIAVSAARNALQGPDAPGRILLVDGSMFAPSYRAMAGGAEVWDTYAGSDDTGAIDADEAYIEELNRIEADLGVYWDEGCLFYGEGEDWS